jgi:phosphinothricin acetyltransferase
VSSTAATITIDALTAADWPAVSAIYADGISTGEATFERTVPTWAEWSDGDVHRHHPALVGRVDGAIVAWAALKPVSSRRVYEGVAEVSVYVGRGHRNQGLGRALLTELIARAEAAGVWTIQAGIFPENLASLGLHRACGFRVVGVRERIGCLDGVWRDVVLLERRSKEVGS